MNIEDKEVEKVMQFIQIFVLDDYASKEEMDAFYEGEEQIANGEYITHNDLKNKLNC